MCCLFKRILAVLLTVALFAASLAACNKDTKQTDGGTSSDGESSFSSADSQQSDVSAEGSDRNSSEDLTKDDEALSSEDAPSEEGSASTDSKEDNNSSSKPEEDSSSKPDEDSSSKPDEDSSSKPDEDSSSKPDEDSSSKPVEDSSSKPEEDSSSKPEEDSSSKPVEDSSSKPVEDSSSKPVEDSSSKPVEDSSSKPVEDSSSKPVEDSSSKPVDTSSKPVDTSSKPVDSSSTPPVQDSSEPWEDDPYEDSSDDTPVEPADPYDPINPLPPTLYPDAVDSFFNDSVFVGYSIMMHFGRYVSEWRSEIDSSIMGDAVFCAGVGISFYSDRTSSSLPMYRGKEYNFKDLPSATGSNTIYIGLMGYSDLKRSSSSSNCVEYAYNETVQGLQRIRNANPTVNIVVLANTYNTGSYIGLNSSRHNNAKIREYNNLVLDYCTASGIDFVDVATPLTDHRGYFVTEYSSDESYHIIKQAYYLWMRALREYAAKKQNGTWQNMADMPPLPAA